MPTPRRSHRGLIATAGAIAILGGGAYGVYRAASTGKPAWTATPVVTGSVQVGSTLSTTNGTWKGSPTTFTYQWEVSTSSTGPWSAISGATATSYTLTSAELTKYVRSKVRATNKYGTTGSAASGSGPVASAPTGGANVFVDPGSGNDSATNCHRYTPAQADPGGTVCATLAKAYALATYGDTVWVRNGTFTARQLFPSTSAGRKLDDATKHCDYIAQNFNGCITFLPESGATVSFNVSVNACCAAPVSAALWMPCVTYARFQNMTFVETTFLASGQSVANELVSNYAYGIGQSNSTCSSVGRPHDDIFENLIVGGPASIDGTDHSCVVNNHATSATNLPWHFSEGIGFTTDSYAHDNCLIGNTFDGFNFVYSGYVDKHMECVTMFSGGTNPGGLSNNTIRNNKLLDCPIEGFFMQIDNPNVADGNLIEGNVFKGGTFPLKLSCHSSGCTISNTILRFNTFATGSGAWDCPVGGCTWTGSTSYGNLLPPCPLATITSNHDLFAGSSCAQSDGTGVFNVTPAYVSAGTPNYNYSLANCSQTAADKWAPGSVGGFPPTDFNGTPRPKPGNPNLDAGAFESCP